MSRCVAQLYIGLVGEETRHDPYASAFGQMARLATVNAFQPGDYFAGFGLRVRRDEDLSHALAFSQARQQALATTLEIGIPVNWSLTTWLPFQLKNATPSEHWEFRYCPACLHSGFHTLLFQLPWIHRCPWHHQRLRTECMRCDRPMTTTGVSGRSLLECECGHSAVDPIAALLVDAETVSVRNTVLEEYLSWSAVERQRTTLIAPASGHADWRRLSEAVQLPEPLRTRAQISVASVPVSIDVARAVGVGATFFDETALQAMQVLSRDDPGIVELPACISHCFNAAARHVAMALPPASLTDREMSLFSPGLGGPDARNFKPAGRKSSTELAYIPPQRIGDRHYLHLHTVAPAVVRTAWSVIQEVAGSAHVGNRLPNTRPLQEAVFVAMRILARGYVEGMRSILARHVPSLLDHGKLRPRYSEPWVWVRRDSSGHRWAIRWCQEPMTD